MLKHHWKSQNLEGDSRFCQIHKISSFDCNIFDFFRQASRVCWVVRGKHEQTLILSFGFEAERASMARFLCVRADLVLERVIAEEEQGG